MRLCFILSFVALCAALSAQNAPFSADKNTIATVQFLLNEKPLYIQSLPLEKQKSLTLAFDYIGNQPPNLYYDIRICDEDWAIVDEPYSFFLQGAQKEYLFNYQFSIAAYSDYLRYSKELFANTSILKSGNYIISIYNDEGGRSTLLCAKRIVFYENKSAVSMRLSSLLNQQENPNLRASVVVKFNDNFQPYNINSTIKTYLLRNGDWNTWQAIRSQPLVSAYNTLVYGQTEYLEFPVFPGYRYFENKNVYMRGDRCSAGSLKESRLHTLIDIDRKDYNAQSAYARFPGYYTVLNESLAGDKNISSEYTFCHFFLQSPPIEDSIYIVGLFNDFATTGDYAMTYNPRSGFYEISLFLKQGNYQYMYAKKKNNAYSLLNEGTHGQQFTQVFSAVVYYRTQESKAPKAIGYADSVF